MFGTMDTGTKLAIALTLGVLITVAIVAVRWITTRMK